MSNIEYDDGPYGQEAERRWFLTVFVCHIGVSPETVAEFDDLLEHVDAASSKSIQQCIAAAMRFGPDSPLDVAPTTKMVKSNTPASTIPVFMTAVHNDAQKQHVNILDIAQYLMRMFTTIRPDVSGRHIKLVVQAIMVRLLVQHTGYVRQVFASPHLDPKSYKSN